MFFRSEMITSVMWPRNNPIPGAYRGITALPAPVLGRGLKSKEIKEIKETKEIKEIKETLQSALYLETQAVNIYVFSFRNDHKGHVATKHPDPGCLSRDNGSCAAGFGSGYQN